VPPRFVLHREVSKYWDFLAADAPIVSADTGLCYRVR
jgi:hypothetical protein